MSDFNNNQKNNQNSDQNRSNLSQRSKSQGQSQARKIKPQDLYPPKNPPKKKLADEERSYHPDEDNLASQKRKLAEERLVSDTEDGGRKDKKKPSVVSEDNLDLRTMSHKERRKYNHQKEKEKLSELTFWRKVQYILMYYSGKFLAVVAGIGAVALIAYRIYVAACPVALDIIIVNDFTNGSFEPVVTELYSSYYEIPERARFYVDTNYELHPNTTFTTADMTYYNKMYSVMTGNTTQVVICESDVVDYYAIDGFAMELKHALPEDLFDYFKDRMYETDGPVEDADYYAIDLTGTKFASMIETSLERPMFCMPSSLNDENRQIAFNFLRMIMLIEEEQEVR